MRALFCRISITACVALGCQTAIAHEYVVKPAAMTVKSGEPVRLEAMSSHVFFAGEELEDAADATACIADGGKRVSVALTPDDKKTSFIATVPAPGDRTFIICGSRKAQFWASTPAGSKRGSRKEFPNATQVRSIEKFSKAIVNARTDDDAWGRPIGDRLEIVPKANPASVKVGDELPVQVLYDGKPLPTRVWATYGGFSQRYMTFAYYTEMENTDVGHIKITQPGVWIVRVEHIDDSKTDTYDRYVARAVLLFEVKG